MDTIRQEFRPFMEGFFCIMIFSIMVYVSFYVIFFDPMDLYFFIIFLIRTLDRRSIYHYLLPFPMVYSPSETKR